MESAWPLANTGIFVCGSTEGCSILPQC
jgi:hypothetical protein